MTIIREHSKLRRTRAAKSLSEHFTQADAQDEYAIAQECLLRDHNERAIRRTNEAYETTPAKPHEDEGETRNHKTATACGEATQPPCDRAVTRNDPDCLRHNKRSGNARHPAGSAAARTGTGTATEAEASGAAQEADKHRINVVGAGKHRRNIIAGLLAVVDAEHADHTAASHWLKYVRVRTPFQMWLPCVHCVKGGSQTLMVNIRADLSLSIKCTNEACEANYRLEHSAPDHDQQISLAEEGADWLASYRQLAKQIEKPWLFVWIGKVWTLTHGPGSKTLKTLLRIYALVRKQSRWPVAKTREFLDARGWMAHGDVPCLHDGNPVPVLLQIDLASIAKQVHLSEKHVAKYLHMIVRIRLLRVAARLQHGQIVYQAGWWFHKSGMPHTRSIWFLAESPKWKRRLRHVSSGQIRF